MENIENDKKSFLSYLLVLLRGVVIGIANVIPGVSGGTLALVLGIFQKFIDAFHSLSQWVISLLKFIFTFKKKNWEKFKEVTKSVDWLWILMLFVGIILAIVLTSGLITYLLKDYPAQTYGLFFGLIIASVVVPYSKMKKKGIPELIAFIIGFVLLFWFSGLKFDPDFIDVNSSFTREGNEIVIKWEEQQEPSEYHVFRAEKNNPEKFLNIKITGNLMYVDDEIEEGKDYIYIVKSIPANPAFWFVIIASALSAAAMILPGLSGSYLLLILGVYGHIFGSFSTLFSDFFGSISIILLYAVGVVIGLLSFSRLLKLLLSKLQSITMGFLIGLMLGSLRVIYPFLDKMNMIPGSDADEIPKLYFWNMPENVLLSEYISSMEFISIILSILFGIAIVLILYFSTRKRNAKTDSL